MGRARAGIVLLLILLVPGAAVAVASPSPSLSSSDRYLVSFEGAAPAAGPLAPQVRVLESFPFAGVALIEGPFAALARLPGAVAVVPEERISLTMERERTMVDADPPSAASDWPSGAGVTVALVDSGIDGSHPAFADRVAASVRISRGGVVSGGSGDSDGHGTHVAGIVAGDGSGSSSARHRGIAPGATLVGIDISDSFTTTNAVRAFAWIHDNAGRYNIRVVSNSWGREKEGAVYDADDPVIRASNALVSGGIVVVFSAGNRGRDGDATLTPEAMNPNVVTVGAASGSGHVEGYSSRGPAVDGDGRFLSWTKPDVMAPGTAVVSTRAGVLADPAARTDEERYYTVMNGTSMAAPQVAAASALLLGAHPELSPEEIKRLLQVTAVDLGAPGADDDTGYGMLDVAAALREASVVSGGERRIIVEKRVPVNAAGSITAALGQVLVANGGARLPPEAKVALPLALPEGSVAVDLWFNWSGSGSFDVRFLGPEGALAFQSVGGQSAHLATAAAPGSYRVDAIPTGTADSNAYTLDGDIIVRQEQVVEVAAEQHGRPVRTAAAFAPAPTESLLALDPLLDAPALVIALAATGAVAVGLLWRRKSA